MLPDVQVIILKKFSKKKLWDKRIFNFKIPTGLKSLRAENLFRRVANSIKSLKKLKSFP